MPSYKTAFPSKFARADDLGQTHPVGTIASVDFELVGAGATPEKKLVAHFAEPNTKPIVLNQINASTIAMLAATDDFEEWVGTRVVLYATTTEFQGKQVACIRLAAPKPKAAAQRKVVVTPKTMVPTSTDPDDGDVPDFGV
jgi:hypothetical protein